MLDVEAQRRTIQDRLDKAKSAAERNRLGQFATPPELALEIARYTSSLLMLYPKAEMKAALEAQPELYPAVFAHLQALTGEHLIRESRVYAGGLHKMESKELANLAAGDLAHMIQ